MEQHYVILNEKFRKTTPFIPQIKIRKYIFLSFPKHYSFYHFFCKISSQGSSSMAPACSLLGFTTASNKQIYQADAIMLSHLNVMYLNKHKKKVALEIVSGDRKDSSLCLS